MNDRTPIDIRAEELARSGDFKSVLQMEPTLYEEYGQTETKNYTNRPATQRMLNQICREARGEGL